MKIEREIPEKFLNIKLTSLLSKHVFTINSDKAFRVMVESLKCGYEYVIWGTARNHTQDFHFNMDIILKMEEDYYSHPLRVIACKYEFSKNLYLWCDNMHSAVKYIREYGEDVQLKDIPFYVVMVVNGEVIKAYDKDHILMESIDGFKGMTECCKKRFERSNNAELLKVKYTVGDFVEDNSEFLAYGKFNNGSVSLEILKDKYCFWDLDGTLATYRFNDHLADPDGTNNGMSEDEIADDIFLKRFPLRKMQKILQHSKSKRDILVGHALCDKEIVDKHIWLNVYYEMIGDRLFISEDKEKHEAIIDYCKKNNIDLKDVLFFDDKIPILQKAERAGIKSYHISSFIDLI